MFFLKYEGGVGGQIDHPPTTPQEKLPSKSPALLGLKISEPSFCYAFVSENE